MNDAQLQEAIDKTRQWLSSQLTSGMTPSLKAKDDAVAALANLQRIQVHRAEFVTLPKIMEIQI
jgi:hypothetical protein